MPINTQGPVSTQAPQSQIPALTISAWDIIWVAGLVLCAVFFISAYIRCYREFQTSLPVENAFARRWLETHNLKTQAVHTTVRSDLGTAYIWRVASSDSYAQEN